MRKLELHGLSADPAYNCWKKMRTRCKNPKDSHYKWYGGRGIVVCERWESFLSFRIDMGPRPSPKHSIERIDNSKGYSPDNCRWATQVEQNKNRSNVYALELDGEILNGAELAARFGVDRTTVTSAMRKHGGQKRGY